ncbi:ABC transporter permease [Candidatus Saccharibacteria bacterium]|nr:ABC transporter permease [Candidatus Saccharibacteria bacterium]
MFWHNYKYAFKTLIKNKALVFWTLIFPFILAILFNMAFARLHDYDVFEAFDVAVVDDQAYKDEKVFSEAFKSLSEEGDDQLFKTQYVSKEKAEELLENEEIEGYVYVADGEPRVKIKTNGLNQTVLTTATEQIAQSAKMIEDIAMTEIVRQVGQEVDVAAVYQNAVKIVSETEPNVKDESRVMNMIVIEFYTLIAMACMQGAMLSSDMMNRCLPNISNRGKRVAVAPTRKSILVASYLLAGYTMLFFSVILLIVFMRFILGVEFGANLGLIIALAAVGSLTATMMGMFLSIILKTNDAAKNVIILIVTMVGCLFAGMFGGMKNYFDESLPLVNKISPVGQITDGFYSLFYYEDMSRFIVNVVSLLAIAAIFFLLSIRSLRRTRYDSV